MSIVVPTLESVSLRDRSPFIRHPVTVCLAVLLMACVNAFGTSYYVDYSSGADGNSGTSTSSPWQHCPGDPAATGAALAHVPQPGDIFNFRAGTTYTLTGDGSTLYQTGIGLNWSGSSAAPITYACSANWSNGSNTNRVIFTDG